MPENDDDPMISVPINKVFLRSLVNSAKLLILLYDSGLLPNDIHLDSGTVIQIRRSVTVGEHIVAEYSL